MLGYTEDPHDPNEPNDFETLIVDPVGEGPGILFIQVPEPKTVKNRLHFDLQPVLDTRDITVDTVIGLGATTVDDRRNPDGTGWVVLADPEGNEFCVERSEEERHGEHLTAVVTSERPAPQARTSDERTVVLEMLDWYRAGVVAKVEGLSDRAASRKLLGSATTILGLVKHLALVEDSWFTDRFAGLPEPAPWANAPWDDDVDWEFNSAVHESLPDLVALYEASCERSRTAYANASLDDLAHDRERPFNLRWALVHIIEETARHLGHLDILRELSDGQTGN